MSTTRAFGIGVVAVLGLVAAIHTNSGTIALLWVAATLGILVVTALFAGGTVGWLSRFMRGLVGGTVAGVAGLAAVLILRRHTDWYDFPADSGGHIWIAILIGLAATPGAIAAAARRNIGLALVAGFDFAMIVWTWPAPGFVVLLAVGTVIGALFSRR